MSKVLKVDGISNLTLRVAFRFHFRSGQFFLMLAFEAFLIQKAVESSGEYVIVLSSIYRFLGMA